ncbi:MAG: class I SAM-dependent methyltransferase [Thermoplasmatota archaeon]
MVVTDHISPGYELRVNAHFGFRQIYPTPSQEEIARYYAQEFYSSAYQKCNDSSLEVQVADAPFYGGHYGDIVAGIEEVLGRQSKGLSVLDIGCGWGQALLRFRESGMNAHGFDPAPEAVAFTRSKGLDVVEAGMVRMKVFDRKFDVVTLLNVLEHLADPVSVLREIRDEVLSPGGVLVVEVPNEFNAWQLAGRDTHHLNDWWVAPPAHLNYFDTKTIRSILEGAGYQVPILEGSFPMEMFLLFGRNYVGEPMLGKSSHKERVAFEANLRAAGRERDLRQFYRALAAIGLGRQVTAFAVSPGGGEL